MFDWWKKKESSNVVPFPGCTPGSEPLTTKEEPAKIFYRLGITDNNRITFQMGYSEITMNKQGCQQLIDQLTVFMNQLDDNET